jgi:hypothetical protein
MNETATLKAKLDHLLDHIQSAKDGQSLPCLNELRLIAILLRVSVHADKDALDPLDDCRFVCRLIKGSRMSNDLYIQYIRLACRVLEQTGKFTTSGERLVGMVQEALKQRHDKSIEQVDVDIVSSLGSWLERIDVRDLQVQVKHLWSVYTSRPTTKPSKGSESTQVDGVNENDDSQVIMIRTIQGLLDKTSTADESTNPVQAWHMAWSTLVTQCEMRLLQSSTFAIYNSLVILWSESKHPFDTHKSRQVWLPCILLLTQTLASLSRDFISKQLSSISSALTRIFLASCTWNKVTVVDNDQTSIPTLTWMTMSQLVDKVGCKWMLQRSPTTSLDKTTKLGKALHFCTIVRMAVGEWKIQLTASLERAHTFQDTVSSVVLDACANLIRHAIDYIVQVSLETDASVYKSVPPEALIHVKVSLEEALDAAVEYLVLREIEQALVDVNVLGLLACLLQEMDAFEVHPTADYPVLNGLQSALAVTDSGSQTALLACICIVLEQACMDNEATRIKAIKDNELMGLD